MSSTRRRVAHARMTRCQPKLVMCVVGLRRHRTRNGHQFAPIGSFPLPSRSPSRVAACPAPHRFRHRSHHFRALRRSRRQSQPAPPVSLNGIDCDDLVSTATVQAALAPDVVIMSPEARLGMWQSGFYDATIQQAGGIVCLWGNGDPARRLRRGSVCSHAADTPPCISDWEARRDTWGVSGISGTWAWPVLDIGDESLSDCGSEDHGYYGTCRFYVRVGEYWLDFDIYGVSIPPRLM